MIDQQIADRMLEVADVLEAAMQQRELRLNVAMDGLRAVRALINNGATRAAIKAHVDYYLGKLET